MEEKNQEPPKMSEFCEAIMERTEDLNDLKSEHDCAMVMCSDGDTLACRFAGNEVQISQIILKKMIEDPVFAQIVSRAENAFVVYISDIIHTSSDNERSDESAKEIQMN